MTPDQIKQFCRALRMNSTSDTAKGWSQMTCPLAPWRHESGADTNPSFGIKLKRNSVSVVHCFACGFTGPASELVLEMRHLSGKDPYYDFKTAYKLAQAEEDTACLELAMMDDEEPVDKDIVHYFSEEWLGTFPRAHNCEDALLYCKSRAMPVWVMKELDLRFDTHERRICFPVRDYDGHLVGLHGRAIDRDTVPKYRMYTYPINKGHNNPKYWFGEHLIDLDQPVVAVESVFDAAKVYEVYRNVMCPKTAEINAASISRIRDATRVITMFDGDKAGRRGAMKLKEALKGVPVATIRLDDGIDPGSMTSMQVRKLLAPYVENQLIPLTKK